LLLLLMLQVLLLLLATLEQLATSRCTKSRPHATESLPVPLTSSRCSVGGYFDFSSLCESSPRGWENWSRVSSAESETETGWEAG